MSDALSAQSTTIWFSLQSKDSQQEQSLQTASNSNCDDADKLERNNSMEPGLIGALFTAVAALAGVVGYMGRWFFKHFEEVKLEVLECRRDRESLWKDRDNLWQKIAEINTKMMEK